jgi:hypothetical protein
MDEELHSLTDSSPYPAPLPAVPSALPRELTVPEIKLRLDKITELMKVAMRQGVDYGKVPGTDKPTLLKPGSEKLCVLFQLGARRPQLDTIHDGDHLTVNASVTLFHIPTGRDVYCGMALCSTRESKYAWRAGSRACPECGSDGTIIKGKAEYGGGWLCWKRKGGCGFKFVDTDPRITKQDIERIPNPDLPDTWNTILKMAVKRAKIDATLGATGASALFTQDIGDDGDAGDDDDLGFEAAQREATKQPEQRKQKPKPASPPEPGLDSDRVAWLRQQCKETEVQESLLCNQYRRSSLEEFTEADYQAAATIFQARRSKMGLQ